MTDETTPTLIGGRYQTVRPIGRGGMGTVWLARDTVLGREVAAKQIGDFPGESEGETRRAMREARAAAALNHPNVVAVYDVTEHEGTPWLVMEYVAGPTLASAIRQRGPMTPKGAADLGAQLAGALAAAHRAGIVHRDIKPANVLIGGGRPKIGDFGIARAGAEDHLTQTGMVTGTPSYMAPEVAVGRDHGEAADVWALGATIYFAVEGVDAHAGQGNALATLRHIATHPPRRPERAGRLEPVLADLLARDPARRGTMAEAHRRLEIIAAGGVEGPRTRGPAVSPQAPPPSGPPGMAPPAMASSPMAPPQQPPPRPAPQRSTRRGPSLLLWAMVGALAALLLVAALAFVLTRDGGSGSGDGSTSGTTEQSSEATDEGFTEDEAREFIEDYFATTTEDRDASWDMLAPARQNDRESYDEFWSSIESVETSNISVDEDAGMVTVTLTYHPVDGDPSSEEQTYRLTRIDGDLKIDANT